MKSFAREIAEKLTSGKNENVLILMIGRQGRGKSYSAMSLACHVALEMADILKLPPSFFFNINHMSIIMESELINVVENLKRYGIYILDDIGTAFGARNFNKKSNKALGNLIQTMRVLNNLMILTVPNAGYIDKIGRESVYYKIVMQPPLKNLKYSDYGITAGKIYKIEPNHIGGKSGVREIYHRENGKKYTHIIFGYPPKPLAEEYDRRRLSITEGIMKDNIVRDLRESFYQEENIQSTPKPKKKDTALDIIRDLEAGVYQNIPQGIRYYKEQGLSDSQIPSASYVRELKSSMC